jgi:hypothetical protein
MHYTRGKNPNSWKHIHKALEAIKGIPSHRKGKIATIETKMKLRLSHLGKPSGRKGKHCSDVHKLKLSIANKGKKLSEITRLKMSINRMGEKHWNWNNGSSFAPYPILFNKQLKDKVRVRDNFTCQLCKKPEMECNRRLAVHHIDYNKSNVSLDNLIALCLSCHMKTNSNQDYWKQHFTKGERCFVA